MRWLIVCAVVAAGYWYLFGLDFRVDSPSYEQKMLRNKSALAQCIREEEYAASRMATSAANAEADCAAKLNLYWEDGGWHNYRESRQ
ncbi:hypothetical protein E2F43_16585 [Seongchinamella unica]|uniref:Uncharacterized protein n=1 Tax=Seongchinamella unica TaxID=2547392 RepID=A0A4R5LNT1_9GAMM|nr:hypothetical protein [Seongchinamella unica]TDG11976.1 hypothetical protein E2F43_16585 [Seongchinamella unica]